jgi:DNA transposition AAA+ family ATPase
MKVDLLSSGSMDDFEIPAFLRKGEDALPLKKLEPIKQKTSDLRKMREEMLKRFDELATHESDTVLVWSRFIQGTQATDSIKALLKDIQALGIDENTSWALLLQWLNNFTMEFEILSHYGRRMLIVTRKHLDEDRTHRVYEMCLEAWG